MDDRYLGDYEQIITCPNCDGKGWRKFVGRRADRFSECCVCDARGFLVIDHKRTQELKPQPMPPNLKTA